MPDSQANQADSSKSTLSKFKGILGTILTTLLVIIVVYVLYMIKSGFDRTTHLVTEDSEKLCGYEACIILDGEFHNQMAKWSLGDFWPLFGVTIETNLRLTEGQKVDIICQIDKNPESLNYLFTKLKFVFKKDQIQTCKIYPAT